MPRRRLELFWWLTAGFYVVALAVIVAVRSGRVAPQPLTLVVVLVLLAAGVGGWFWLRPRPLQPNPPSSEDRSHGDVLRALRRGQPAGPASQRLEAADRSRCNLLAGLYQAMVWAMLGVNTFTDENAETWFYVMTVVGCTVCVVGMLAARWRMTQLDGWEAHALVEGGEAVGAPEVDHGPTR